jgi:hypothetical protein
MKNKTNAVMYTDSGVGVAPVKSAHAAFVIRAPSNKSTSETSSSIGVNERYPRTEKTTERAASAESSIRTNRYMVVLFRKESMKFMAVK